MASCWTINKRITFRRHPTSRPKCVARPERCSLSQLCLPFRFVCVRLCVLLQSGLMHTLRGLCWFDNVDIDTFFPRCYDLSDPGDYADFVDDFRSIEAHKIVASVLAKVQV
jgi:hypothetical protein